MAAVGNEAAHNSDSLDKPAVENLLSNLNDFLRRFS